MKTPLRTLLLAAAAAIALTGGQAHAGLITVTDVEMPQNEIVSLNNIDPSAPQEVYAGQTVFTTASPTSTIYAWCIDMFHEIGLGGGQNLVYNETPFVPNVTTDNASPAHTLSASVLSKMTGLMILGDDILQDNGLGAANMHYGTTGTLADWSAAVQLAIWDTEYLPNYPSGLSWSGGTTETGVIYADLLTAPLTGNGIELAAVGNQQSFGFPDAVPTPEPPSMLMLALGLIGVGFVHTRWGKSTA